MVLLNGCNCHTIKNKCEIHKERPEKDSDEDSDDDCVEVQKELLEKECDVVGCIGKLSPKHFLVKPSDSLV